MSAGLQYLPWMLMAVASDIVFVLSEADARGYPLPAQSPYPLFSPF
jgi:hypothetical protein